MKFRAWSFQSRAETQRPIGWQEPSSRPSTQSRTGTADQDQEGEMQRRALVVDDEQATCELIQKVLYAAGVDALTLTSSGQAASFLEEGKFDMVFFDLHMGSRDGIELSREMRRAGSNRTTPIILLSDDQRPSAMSQGFAAGASFFLYKPVDRERLLKLIRATQGRMDHE